MTPVFTQSITDCTGITTGQRYPYLAGANLMELPIATWRVFKQNLPVGGGAYLRILPYTLMKYGVRAINKYENIPAVLYLHPWEIDDSQPRLEASWKSRMRQYSGLAGLKSRLERLLQQFALGRIYDSVYLPALARIRDLIPPCSQSEPRDSITGDRLIPQHSLGSSTYADTDVH